MVYGVVAGQVSSGSFGNRPVAPQLPSFTSLILEFQAALYVIPAAAFDFLGGDGQARAFFFRVPGQAPLSSEFYHSGRGASHRWWAPPVAAQQVL